MCRQGPRTLNEDAFELPNVVRLVWQRLAVVKIGNEFAFKVLDSKKRKAARRGKLEGRKRARKNSSQKSAKIGKIRGGLESQFPFAADDGTSSLSFYHRLLSFRLRFYHDSGEVQ